MRKSKGGGIMSESKLRDLSIDFSVQIIQMCENIKGHYSLVNQLERSATSIGANIYEANYAHGTPDFIAKLQIALKECYESDYWLGLFKDTNMITQNEYDTLFSQCSKIRKLLIASITTAKSSEGK